jgi:hypothetical protein
MTSESADFAAATPVAIHVLDTERDIQFLKLPWELVQNLAKHETDTRPVPFW